MQMNAFAKKYFEKIKNVRSCVFAFLVTAFCLMISYGYYCCPTPLRLYEPQGDDVLETQYITSRTVTHSIDADDEGHLTLNGEDCYFEIHDIQNSGSTVVLYFAEPYETAGPVFSVTIDYGDGNGFHENPGEEVYFNSNKNAECVCISLPTDQYTALRIRPNMSLHITKVEIHSEKPVTVEKKIAYSKKRILKSVLVGLALSCMLIMLESVLEISKHICLFVKNNKKQIVQDVFILSGPVLISIGCNRLFGAGQFSVAYNALIATAVCSAAVLIRNLIDKTIPVEQTFLVLILLLGSCMMACAWPNISWDAGMHYESTLLSTQAGTEVGVTDGNAPFLGEIDYTDSTYTEIVSSIDEREPGITYWLQGKTEAIRLPAAIFMILGNVLGVTPYANYLLGRIGQLLVFALCGYFGIKRLHSGKMIFAIIFAMPANIFVATNYSYDYMVTGFLMLGMAYFVAMCQEKDEIISYKDVIIMLAAFYVGCMPKQIYVPILLFPFLLSVKKLQGKKKPYYILCVITTILTALSFARASYGNMTGGGDPRAGLGTVDPVAQVQFIFGHPLWYTKVLVQYLLEWWNPSVWQTGTYLAYLGAGAGYTLILLMLAVAMVTDKNAFDEGAYSVKIRVYSVLHFIGVSALIVTALYVVFSPIGSTYMLGAQPRYYLPLIYPLCSVLMGRGISARKYIPSHIYETLMLLSVFAVGYYDVYQLMLPLTLH